MKSNTLLFLISLAFCIQLSAQQKKKNMQDVIYLKNGSVIRGTLLEHEPKKMMKIETLDGSVWVFEYDEIDKWAIEPTLKSGKVRGGKLISYPVKGYYNMSQIHLWIADPSRDVFYDATTVPAISNINGYRFTRQLAAGLGIGIDLYERGIMMPVFADIRADLFKQKQLTPHFSMQGGYSIPLSNNQVVNWQGQNTEARNYGGLRYGANAGIHIFTASRISWIFSAGYHFQKSKLKYEGNRFEDERIEERFTYKRISIQLGLMF